MENVEIIPTKGHPLVYADWLHAPGKPTVLCYAHYDVQPPDPLERMDHAALRAHRAQRQHLCARRGRRQRPALDGSQSPRIADARPHGGKLPINVKFIFEGEEEVGGESIAAYRAQGEGQAESRFRAGLRYRTFRARSSHALRRTARPGLYRDRSRRARRPICTPACTAAPRPIPSSA